MHATTRLRRQFRKAALNPTANLIYKGDLFHYSRRVPVEARRADPSLPQAIRRSTGTDQLKEAQYIARQWAKEHEALWLALVDGSSDGPWLSALAVAPERTVEDAADVLYQRAEALGFGEAVQSSTKLSADAMAALRADPQASAALRVVYKAAGKPLTWTAAWEDFEGRSGLSRKTRLTYASSCVQFDKAKLPGPSDITREQARAFLKQRAQEVTQSTVNIHMAAATAILTDLFDGKPEKAKLFRGHKLRYAVKAKPRDLLSRDDLRALLKSGRVGEHLAMFLRLALGTGARRDELYNGELDLERRLLTIRTAKNSFSVRQVPLATRLIPVAEAWSAAKRAGQVPSIQKLQNDLASARDVRGFRATRPCTHVATLSPLSWHARGYLRTDAKN